ncbi:LuxR C-terminal-related transcriptional regulator [Streptomyces avicenniae]|uniref:LuxR C-terminal-related transcriptional regulator n=1 Tax=Streptomyces avicenniae TaxID=500153 RepID=UPI00069BE095|nr:LuxR family transcriptional regulator [Streptomyces avicenniae]
MHQNLVERWSELLVLNRTIDTLCRGVGDLLFIEGGFGIGRTALLLELERAARARQVIMCTARCGSLEADYPYGVMQQLLEPHLSALAAGHTEAARPAAELLRVMDSCVSPEGDTGDISVLSGMLCAIRGMAERAPVVLAVDDMNFCDAPSLHVLAYVARRLKGWPVAIVATRRLGEPVASPPMLAALCAAGEWTVLHPAPLTEAGTGDLAVGLLGPTPTPVVDELHRLTAGSPAVLHTMLRAGAGPHQEPGGAVWSTGAIEGLVAAKVQERLAHLPAAVGRVAETVALLEGEADAALVAEAAGIPMREAAASLAVLGAMGLLTDLAQPSYTSPVVGRALRRLPEAVAPDRIHRRAAEVLHQRNADPAAIVRHVLRTGPIGAAWVPEVLRAEADKAVPEGKPAEAHALLRRALHEPLADDVRDDVQASLDCVELITDPRGLLVRLRPRLKAARTPRTRVSTVLTYAQALVRSHRIEEAAETLHECRGDLAALPPTRSRDALLRQLDSGEAMAALLGTSGAGDTARLLAQLPDDSPDDTLHRTSLRALHAAVEGRTPAAEVVEALRGAFAADLDSGREPQLMPYTLYTLLWADELDLVYQRCDAVLTGRQGVGGLSRTIMALALRSACQLEMGRLEGAERDARQALGFLGGQDGGADLIQSLVLVPLLNVLTELDRTDEAMALLGARGSAGALPEFWPHTLLLAARGRLKGARGDIEGALADLKESGRRMEGWGTDNPGISRWRSEAAFMKNQLGDVAGAVALVEEEVRAARRWGTPRAVGVALRAKGLILGGAEGLAALTEAVEVLRSGAAHLETAYAEASLGIVQRHENNRREARETLRRALTLAQRLGALRLAGRVHTELLAAGGLPRRSEHFGTKALTASEYRVALLAAVGRTNGAIARELFVTRRTVETHLTRAYRKLGIQSRSELGRVLQV